MRVVGYVRETSGPDNGESSYAQSERVRRWAARGGHALVALCQDTPQPGRAQGREGLRALVSIIEAGQADVVVLPALATLSHDKIVQEIMLWDLRMRGASVLVTEEAELADLVEPSADPVRLLVRDVLARVAEYGEEIALSEQGPTVVDLTTPEVVVELIRAEEQAAS